MTHLIGEDEQLVGGGNVGSDTQIALLGSHHFEKPLPRRILRQRRSLSKPQTPTAAAARLHRRRNPNPTILLQEPPNGGLRLLRHPAGLHQQPHHVPQLQQGVQPHPGVGQVLPPALLPVEEHHGVADLQPGGAERRGGLQHGGAAGDKVLDEEAGLAGAEGALDGLAGAVLLDLLAAHEHGDGVGDGDAGGDGERRVGDPAEEVELGSGGGDGGEEELGDVVEEGRVGDDEAEVNVDGGWDAGLELEVAELDGFDIVELEEERVHPHHPSDCDCPRKWKLGEAKTMRGTSAAELWLWW